MGRAARHEPAQRVPDERNLLDRDRPRLHDLPEQCGQVAPVVRDVQARVEAQVEGRVAEVIREPAAVALALARVPRVLRLHQAVDEDREARRRIRERVGKRGGRRRDDLPADPDRHRRGQRRPLGLERVAQDAVEHPERGGAPRGRGDRAPLARPPRGERGVARGAGGRERAADRAVHPARDRLVGAAHGLRLGPHAVEHARRDRGVNLADAAGQRAELAGGEPGEVAYLVGVGHRPELPRAPGRVTPSPGPAHRGARI